MGSSSLVVEDFVHQQLVLHPRLVCSTSASFRSKNGYPGKLMSCSSRHRTAQDSNKTKSQVPEMPGFEHLEGSPHTKTYPPWNEQQTPLKIVVSKRNLLIQGSKYLQGLSWFQGGYSWLYPCFLVYAKLNSTICTPKHPRFFSVSVGLDGADNHDHQKNGSFTISIH